jgi:hypothetical protein
MTEPQLTVLVLQDTPPAMAMGVQPVPMGMFRPLSTTLRSGPRRPWVVESRLLEFSTFWQHCAPPVVEPPEPELLGMADTAPTRVRAVRRILENMVAGEIVEESSASGGSSSLRQHSKRDLRSYMRGVYAHMRCAYVMLCWGQEMT